MDLFRFLVIGAAVLTAILGLCITPVLAEPRLPALLLFGTPIEVESRCIPGGGSGSLSLNLPGGYIALNVSPDAPFAQMTGLELAGVDPSSVPSTPGRPNSAVILYVGAEENCGEAELSHLPVAITLSVYRLGSPQGGLGLARLDGGQWNIIAKTSLNSGFYSNPPLNDGVILTTIQQTGTYAAYRQP